MSEPVRDRHLVILHNADPTITVPIGVGIAGPDNEIIEQVFLTLPDAERFGQHFFETFNKLIGATSEGGAQ
jgi:hypothetical protein